MPETLNLNLLAAYAFFGVIVLAIFVLGLAALLGRGGFARLHAKHDLSTGEIVIGGEIGNDVDSRQSLEGRRVDSGSASGSPSLTPPSNSPPPPALPR